ncbi:hypothetical protein AB0E27_05885 [Streptomyces sparsogenes]|uniref:hypothetical protein n=1 Tax=Streptomyces sparsogenes TaxID=67365 RepID=UPI00340A881A
MIPSSPAAPPRLGRRRRLELPPPLAADAGYDAVALPERQGRQVMELLPRAGCVYSASGRWWWIVPPRSDSGLNWPQIAEYSVGAVLTGAPERPNAAAESPRLVHRPEGTVPYTHPLVLHIAVCAVAGVSPSWPD